jgi:hypothetical protein
MIDQGDSRVPVVAGDPGQAGPGDVVANAAPTASFGHAIGCGCCRARAPLADALARLFLARARGEIAFFARVVVPCAPNDESALAALLAADPVTAARFRFAGRLAP